VNKTAASVTHLQSASLLHAYSCITAAPSSCTSTNQNFIQLFNKLA